ncbi:uncharacterized protein PHALS_12532 [Plasmopara halstedii]|uniref:Uncharacterized protein n=1 Tax=Plasmopara halstedii TaxID=4781 RepID=A0A0P1ALP7_PLAHL|nr:uncharacterized protein PHALS_12532 [Plasmopara halstedii]CEG42239.1 hypothetical protein PHALS_12532 [Plasmopara halstedii]|eukprot:XP_024578608.1 hypothetical protein PHALS_12532 [Plasmopara halstedii]
MTDDDGTSVPEIRLHIQIEGWGLHEPGITATSINFIYLYYQFFLTLQLQQFSIAMSSNEFDSIFFEGVRWTQQATQRT